MAPKPTVWFDSGNWYYSASALGRCLRGLTAARMGIKPMDTSKHKASQLVFKEGHLHESAVVASLGEEGINVTDSQMEVLLHVRDNIYICGHIDGLIDPDLAEFKSMSGDVFKHWMRSGLSDGYYDPYFYGYAVQLTIYMAALGKSARYFAKNRNSGELDERLISIPPIPISEVMARVESVESWAELDSFPFCDKPSFPCPYYHIHEPDESPDNATDDIPEALDDLLDAISTEYNKAHQLEEAAKNRKKLAREKLINALNVTVGDNVEWKRRGWETIFQTVNSTRLDSVVAKKILTEVGRLDEAMEKSSTLKLTVRPSSPSSNPPSPTDPHSAS